MFTTVLLAAALGGPFEGSAARDAAPVREATLYTAFLLQDEEAPAGGGETLDARATIELADRAELSIAQSGVLVSDVPAEGERVIKGQTVIRLDSEVPRATLRVAEVTARSNIDEELARKYYDVARTEFNQARAANEQVADAVSALELERLRLTAERSRLDIFKAQHEQDVAIAREEEARAALDTFDVGVPFDGVVTKRFKRRGEAVRPGDPILEMVSLDRVYVTMKLPVRYLAKVKVGTKVNVFEQYGPNYENPAAGTPLLGKVVLFRPAASVLGLRGSSLLEGGRPSLDGEVQVLVEVENTDQRLLPGLQARVVLPE